MSQPEETLDAVLDDLVFHTHYSFEAPATTDEALDRYQDFLGVVFPEDYREVAKRHAGLGEFGQLVIGSPRRFEQARVVRLGGFLPIYGEPEECRVELDREAMRLDFDYLWPGLSWLDQLIPFAHESQWGFWYCFDFAYDPVNPPVIWIHADLVVSVEFTHGVEFVARDFREFLSVIVDRYSLDEDEDVRFEKIESLEGEPWVRSEEHRLWTAHRDRILGLD